MAQADGAIPARPGFGAPARPFQDAATEVLGRLQRAFVELLKVGPGTPRKAAEVERAFRVDYKLGWQIHRIATEENPLAAGAHVPARVSIQRLLKSAARVGVGEEVRREIGEAFDAFERLLESEAHDRMELDAMMQGFVPEAREKNELAIKQSAFRAQSQLKGVALEAQVGAFFLHPSKDGKMVDRATFSAFVGLRRLRADAHIGFATISASGTGASVLTLDGAVPDSAHSILLAEFCSAPAPKFDTARFGSTASYSVAGANVGMRSAVDLVMGEYRPAAMRRYVMPDGKRMAGVMNLPDMPMKRQITDVYLHRDVYPGSTPQIGVYDTVPRGMVQRLDDPERERDRIPFKESMALIAGGPRAALAGPLERYVQMLDHVCGKLGWDPDAFRGYRLDVTFPVYGAQYMVGFALPEAP